jgi:hypothetical protein
MKFYLIAVLAVFMMIGTASAQHAHIGIKGGLNIFNVYHDNDTKYDYKAGFHAGLLAHIHISDHFAIQPELVYSTQGAHYKYFNTNTNYNLDYINAPILFQYMFDNGFRIQVGPQIGFLISAKSKNDNFSYDHKDDIKPVDVGIAAGMSYVSSSGFGVDARYVHGLTSINENGNVNSYNRGFQLGVFYIFKHTS